ncbi:orotidine-5'-phosphate decarboxylase [Spiribacter vilamensis]|uniref:Orotidine 5'-phosphate decarboxylase n=1 Tax=Spiribacter vilamensis TaxID=531306 RepID=A0A4Q8D0L7_9GAMM|nr:orotidine-5'-phosphate decarboxylase [Spiribacter vilamensis]RZU98812.1 orotidine-5'-phosphate decarboxylase [Spiribacter vilamensis]TVO62168.1 orotidine-5'-phosphate decarboxylase [Spiribacter vilamensis]
MNSTPDLIVALDFDSADAARRLVDTLEPGSCRLKVGKALFTRAGPTLVEGWVRDGWDVFLDLKFHDIPNTVAGACRAAADLGVWMVNVHALGGPAMLAAARAAIDEGGAHRPLLTAVTVLTSHDQASLDAVGLQGTPAEAVTRLTGLAVAAGLDGVVCSGQEAARVRAQTGEAFRRVTPGVRPRGSAADDQRRILTPTDAMRAGATDLVVGRPITNAADPARAVESIANEMAVTMQAAADR